MEMKPTPLSSATAWVAPLVTGIVTGIEAIRAWTTPDSIKGVSVIVNLTDDGWGSVTVRYPIKLGDPIPKIGDTVNLQAIFQPPVDDDDDATGEIAVVTKNQLDEAMITE